MPCGPPEGPFICNLPNPFIRYVIRRNVLRSVSGCAQNVPRDKQDGDIGDGVVRNTQFCFRKITPDKETTHGKGCEP